jgi:hypothetical protein
MRTPELLLAPIAALAAALATAAPAVSAKAGDPEVLRLRGQVERLRQERGLAGGKGFYLRLDASRLRVALMLEGVALDDYAATALEWGVPEVLFVEREPGPDWDAAAFTKGRLEPERERDRIEIVAPAPNASPSPPSVPRSAEEVYSVPSPFRIVFAEGVSLEVRARGEGGRNRSVLRRAADAARLRLSDLGTAFGIGGGERVRLRLSLDADDAASLYRSLPPDVGLIVVGLPPR